MIQTVIDPPSGWQYGFPKVIPSEIIRYGRTKKWLLEQGYPKEEMDKYGKHFSCRYWTEDIKEDE